MKATLPLFRPSARVLEYLIRRGKIAPSNMALTTVESPAESPEILAPPPAVVTTPCDPWPRPYEFDQELGLRRVAPYHFTYNTNCKQRWRGREILEIFKDEFRDRPAEYYVRVKITSKFALDWRTNTSSKAQSPAAQST